MKNFSRQREAILSVLRSTNTHPTADWIYTETRKVLPKISLGTVYRNLSELSRAGEILSIDVRDGKEHFDGDISPHLHLHCNCCGDIADAKLQDDPFKCLTQDFGFKASTPVYVVYGICKDCQQNNIEIKN